MFCKSEVNRDRKVDMHILKLDVNVIELSSADTKHVFGLWVFEGRMKVSCYAVELLRFLIKVCNLIKLKDELKVDSF